MRVGRPGPASCYYLAVLSHLGPPPPRGLHVAQHLEGAHPLAVLAGHRGDKNRIGGVARGQVTARLRVLHLRKGNAQISPE
eukprot:542539-Prorocentrum_minimum.AAC.1